MGGKGGPLWRKVTYFLGSPEETTAGRLVVEDSRGRKEERTTSSIFDYLEAVRLQGTQGRWKS